jgi:SAM-dependent methyltransferase
MREAERTAEQAAAIDHNRRAWDRLAADGVPLARPATDEAFGDPRGWLGSAGSDTRPWLPTRLAGLDVLCLAAGGGKHGPLYAAAGARVTVLDVSPAMLALDRAVARERRIDLEIFEGSMDDLSMFTTARFDLVIHPVSTCYLPDVSVVFREVARVTRGNGLYVSQHKSPASLQAGIVPNDRGRYELEHPQQSRTLLPAMPPSRLPEEPSRASWRWLPEWERRTVVESKSAAKPEASLIRARKGPSVDTITTRPAEPATATGRFWCTARLWRNRLPESSPLAEAAAPRASRVIQENWRAWWPAE